jgi:hypothetical protein
LDLPLPGPGLPFFFAGASQVPPPSLEILNDLVSAAAAAIATAAAPASTPQKKPLLFSAMGSF